MIFLLFMEVPACYNKKKTIYNEVILISIYVVTQ
jgi:hypothetical protein